MKKSIFTSIFMGLSFFGMSQSNNTIKKETKHVIDSLYNALIDKHKIVGTSIAIVDNGEIVYSQGYGFTNKEQQIKTNDTSIFRIGSCTKVFTALSIMKLQEEGKLNVNEPIKKHIPELSLNQRFDVENTLLVRDILTHTSGLPGDIINGSFTDNPPSSDWTIKQLNRTTYAAPNQYQWAYSNVGYELLGETVSRLSGKSYSDYLKSEIFNSIGMESSYVEGKTPIGYLDGKKIMEPSIRDQSAGLIHSNAIDMGKYLIMLLNKGKVENNSLVSSESIIEMEKNHIADVLFNNGSKWGYGLYKKNIKIESEEDTLTAELIGHGGDTWAFHADFKYIPELGIGAIIMTNTDKGTRIASATYLLNKYFKLEKNQKLNTRLPKQKNTNIIEEVPTNEEIKGFYGIAHFPCEVDDTEKVKVKMGFARLILTPKNDSMKYNVKLLLLGLIPIKMKNQEIQFVKIEEEVLLKNINIGAKFEYYEGKKVEKKHISEEWKNATGKYRSINDFACADCPSKLKKSKLKIKEKSGMLFFKLETTGWVSGKCFLNIIDNEIAVTDGMGRGTGETVRILENGNLFYSGYEFEKK